ncbi:propionyl-CoA carboxylase carboxyl transferase subunit [Algibacter lectus]|uniref:Propionyl-CoA carboxylase carboxyl transferase subunit n=1 Tax=Algibacter lectus TaxID=221126 RepID=A0A090VGD9_9FLAO|nr:propionyl-CoA carboxylase carboxyl transferase subunit [Algibacter lectus]
MDSKVDQLNKRIAEAHLGGGQKRIDKQHAKKKLTARERVNYIMDQGSFEETGALVTHRTTDFGMENQLYYGDGVITGYGTINVDWYIFTPKILLFLVVPYQKLMLKRFVK